MRQFLADDYTSIAELVLGFQTFLEREVLAPFVKRLAPVLGQLRTEISELRSQFLLRQPATPWASDEAERGFYIESTKRDLGASIRRFSLGTQSRGLHLHMRQARTKEEHLWLAQQLEHPCSLAGRVLESDWAYVFAQLSAGFKLFGVADTFVRLNDYRYSILHWITQVHKRVEPLQVQLNRHMPAGPKQIAGHVKTVLLYLLLSVCDFPNPDLA